MGGVRSPANANVAMALDFGRITLSVRVVVRLFHFGHHFQGAG
jgi:hypothetical protein